MKKKHIILIIIIIAIACICFAIFIPKPFVKNNQPISDIHVEYEGEEMELTEGHYDLLVKELENATKQIQFRPNKTHFLENTYNIDFIYDNKPYHMVVKADTQWMYSDITYRVITESPLFEVLNIAALEVKELSDEPYTFEVEIGSPEWEAMTPVEQSVAFYVPQDLLDNMTTRAVLETTLNYPYIADMYAFDTREMGIKMIAERYNPLAELLTRPDAIEVLQKYQQENEVFTDDETIMWKVEDAKWLEEYIRTSESKDVVD